MTKKVIKFVKNHNLTDQQLQFWNLMVIYQTPMTNTFDEFHAWVKAYHNQPAVAQPSLLLSKSKPINGFAIEQIKKITQSCPSS